MKTNMKALMLVVSLGVLGGAHAADFQPCTKIVKAADRLACFDKFAADQMAEMKSRAPQPEQRPFLDKHITDQVPPATAN